MQDIWFGRICDLPVSQGEPVLRKANIVKRRKLTRPQATIRFSDEFQLKAEHIELFQMLEEIHNGIIACLDVQNGLPCQIDIVENV